MRSVVEVDEKRGLVVIQVNNVNVTFEGRWLADGKLHMRVISKEKPYAQVLDQEACWIPRAAFAAATRQAAQILRERRERQLSIQGSSES